MEFDKWHGVHRDYCNAGVNHFFLSADGKVLRCSRLGLEGLIAAFDDHDLKSKISSVRLETNKSCSNGTCLKQCEGDITIQKIGEHWHYGHHVRDKKSDDLSWCVLNVFITNFCNYGCWYCMVDEAMKAGQKKTEASVESWLNVFDVFGELYRTGSVWLLGGEPTVKKGIVEIIESILRLKWEIILTTNGYGGAIMDRIIALLEQYQPESFKVNVSLHPSEDRFNWEQIEGLLSKLVQRGAHVSATLAGIPTQIHLANEYREKAAKIGVENFHVHYPVGIKTFVRDVNGFMEISTALVESSTLVDLEDKNG